MPQIISSSVSDNSSIQTPLGDGIIIDNVNQSLWLYIKTHQLWQACVFIPFIIVWEVFVIIVFIKLLHTNPNTNTALSGRDFGFLFVIPFLPFITWLLQVRKQFVDAFLEEFARNNQYSFDKTGVVNEAYGTIFRMNGRQSVSDVISGTYGTAGLRLFLYELVVGSGRYQQTFQKTVLELDLHGQLPNLLLVDKHSNYGQLNLTHAFGIDNTISLEGNFNDYFTLYGPKGNEIEALEVFSPDIMALMEDESADYSVEFAGNRIYIYSHGEVSKIEQLTKLFTLAKKLTDTIAPLASRLAHDSAIIVTPVNLIQNRKTHSFIKKFGAVIIMLSFIGIGVVGIAGILSTPAMNTSQQTTGPSTAQLTTPSSGVSEGPQPPTAAQISQGLAVSNQFIIDLHQGNSAAAYALNSPGWQAKYPASVALNEYQSFNISSDSYALLSQGDGVSTSSGHEYISYVYRYSLSPTSFYYVKTWVEYFNNAWEIALFQGDTAILQP